MTSTDKYKYIIELKYMKVNSKTYVNIKRENIEYCIIDRDYDGFNMPMIYMGLALDKNLIDDMILNEKTNIIFLELYKYRYDDEGWQLGVEELCIRTQCTYFMTGDLNPDKDLDYADTENGIRTDVFKHVEVGLMSIDLINQNKVPFNLTFDQTTLVNGLSTIVKHIPNLLMEPLTYGSELLNQICIYKDSVSKSLDALNKVKVLYSSSYRYFMDFDTTYILSTRGIEVPKKGERISAVLVCIKKPEDYMGMDDGVYVNKKQKNYQINVNSQSTSVYIDKLTDKIYNSMVAITNNGDKVSMDLNIDKSSYGSVKTKTVYIPNDNIHMADNFKAQTENSGVCITICKESIDTDVFTPNHRIIIKNIDDYAANNGDYLMTRKREVFVRDGYGYILSTIVSMRKIR